VSEPFVAEMRAWGLVAAAELERVVVVSPHLDDAVLGCAHFLNAHPGTTVVTVFAGRPESYPTPMERWDALCGFVPGDEVHVARRAEDTAALALLGATPRWLDFVEHSYLERSAWARADDIVEVLEPTLAALEPTAVLAPFGLGNPDHAHTHDACLLVRERLAPDVAWFCYEDTGYKHIPGVLARRIAGLLRGGIWPTPAALPLRVDDDHKRRAIECYPSQLRALEADWQIGAKLAAPAPEQYWRLAPPVPGWDAFADT